MSGKDIYSRLLSICPWKRNQPLSLTPWTLIALAIISAWSLGLANDVVAQSGKEKEEQSFDPNSPDHAGDAADIYIKPLISIVKGINLMPLFASDTPIVIKKGPKLHAEAAEIFWAGNRELAQQLMFGHMLSEYEEAKPLLLDAKYCSLMKRPAWAIRWATSIEIRGSGLTPNPIQNSDGSTLRALSSSDNSQRGINGGNSGFGSDPGDNAVESPPMLDSEVNRLLVENLGLVATLAAGEFDQRFSSGSFGDMLSNMMTAKNQTDATEGSSPVRMITSQTSDMLGEAPESLPMWRPGLVFLGEGSSSEQLEKARKYEIDVLLHFNVSLKEAWQPGSQKSTSQNISRVRLISVASGKTLVMSKPMDSMEVWKQQARGRMDDPSSYIEDQMLAFWQVVSREVKMAPLPKLSSEFAHRRVGSLLASGNPRNLQTLAEIRLYEAMELIKPEEVENAFDMIGSTQALTLIVGATGERLAMARKWAIQSADKDRP